MLRINVITAKALLLRSFLLSLCLLATTAFAAGNTPLHDAAIRGDRVKAESLLAQGADINARADDGSTPLIEAVFKDRSNVAELLIAKGADVNAKTKHGHPSLLFAAMHGNRAIAVLLIAKGADVNARTENGLTPLMEAVGKSRANVVELLIARGADVNAKTMKGLSPLHFAAQNGNKAIAALLIAKGANVNATANDGLTPLHYAAANGQKDVAELLVARGANVNARGDHDLTPLHLAAVTGQRNIAEFLIDKGADVNAKNRNGARALDMAEQKGKKDVAELLIARGAYPTAARREQTHEDARPQESQAHQAEIDRQNAIAEQERKEARRRDRREALGVLRNYADTSASAGNQKPSNRLARIEALTKKPEEGDNRVSRALNTYSDRVNRNYPNAAAPAATTPYQGATNRGSTDSVGTSRQGENSSDRGSTSSPQRNTSGTSKPDVQDFPQPDRNGCLQVIENQRGKWCGNPSSLSVTVKNTCAEEIRISLCLWDMQNGRNRWTCGSSSGGIGNKSGNYVCSSDGRYFYAGCSKQSQKGRFRNGNCGGDPNSGRHARIPN